ncbi:MAG: hypothetical protein LBG11_11410 [Bifidobacteriaceae bacterium]|jgi:hypothetical protein|nr:hypothetical protein [Bifidobacteriaceae bacterium]
MTDRASLAWPKALDRITLGQASQLAGVPKANLSRYRSGALTPGPRALQRLEDAAAADNPAALTRLATIPRYAAAVGRALTARPARPEHQSVADSAMKPVDPTGPGEADSVYLVRLARQVLQDAVQVESSGDRRAFLGCPVRLPSPVWNALLGGIAAYTAHRVFRMPEPEWTRHAICFLPAPLSPFPGLRPDRLWWDWTMSPPEFAHRKVILSAGELQWT